MIGRNDNFMKMVREVQEAKRSVVSAQNEIAAAKSKSGPPYVDICLEYISVKIWAVSIE